MKKNALVTGGAGGIGLAIVKQLVADGYHVTAVGRSPLEKVARRFEGLDVTYVQGDLTRAEDREKAVAAATVDGHLDALVNVAGVAPKVRADLLEMTEESYDYVMDINLKATLFLSQLAARQMISQPLIGRRRGVIVNIASISSYTSSINRGEYCLSKAGMSMLTKLLADRLAPEAIPVFEVRPGIIATDMTAPVRDKYDKLIAQGRFPIARWGLPEDVAGAVSVLCSDKLTYSTGDVINVDGGFHLHRL